MSKYTLALSNNMVVITKTVGGDLVRSISVVGLEIERRSKGFKIGSFYLHLHDTDEASMSDLQDTIFALIGDVAVTTLQPNWTQTDVDAPDFIKNKPDGASGTFNDKDSNVVTVDSGLITNLDT